MLLGTGQGLGKSGEHDSTAKGEGGQPARAAQASQAPPAASQAGDAKKDLAEWEDFTNTLNEEQKELFKRMVADQVGSACAWIPLYVPCPVRAREHRREFTRSDVVWRRHGVQQRRKCCFWSLAFVAGVLASVPQHGMYGAWLLSV